MKTCAGAPPSQACAWAIYTRDGRVLVGFGQTAFKAAASVGLTLPECNELVPNEEGE